MNKIKIAITGCLGRMGQQITKSSKLDKKFKLVALTENRKINRKIYGIKPELNDENAFKKATKIVSETARTKIVEKTDSFIHAEAKTKWRRYTDDLLLKAIPEKGIIQVRSESRVGVGDNGVNQKRVDDFAYRLMIEREITN